VSTSALLTPEEPKAAAATVTLAAGVPLPAGALAKEAMQELSRGGETFAPNRFPLPVTSEAMQELSRGGETFAPNRFPLQVT
jgi:hypothetical protein